MKLSINIPFAAACFLANVHAIELAPVFSDHLVLQQAMPVPIWGTGTAGEIVNVSFAGQQATTKTDAQGKWMVKLTPLTASAKPEILTAKAASGETKIIDVLVGEVWIASGQSNMALPLANSAGTPEAKAPNPLVRLLNVPLNPQAKPITTIKASWELSDSTTHGRFSAVAWFFANHLAETRKVPIGIINSSVGGTPARAWTPWDAMASDPRLKSETDRIVTEMKNYDAEESNKKYQQALAKYKAQLAKPAANGKKPVAPKPPAAPDSYQHSPSALYNGMIAPLVPMAIQGAIWYQGEADRKSPDQYRILFPTMIQSWRKSFGHELPFLFVQIAPFQDMTPEIRNAQLFTWRTVPKTSMVVITDYGDATNIHPKQKQPVGERLGLAARAIAYGEKITYSGPVFDKLKVTGSNAILSFQHLGDGLMVKGDTLKGFEISSDHKTFVPAQAVIAGDTVVVTSETVKTPVAVRFGWTTVPDTNLFNKNNLPATPFHTDAK